MEILGYPRKFTEVRASGNPWRLNLPRIYPYLVVERSWEERCQAHFERAVELSGGQRPSPYLSMASSVSVPKQRRDEFETLIEQAMAIDIYANPNELTANLFYQQRAELLLSQIDDLFI